MATKLDAVKANGIKLLRRLYKEYEDTAETEMNRSRLFELYAEIGLPSRDGEEAFEHLEEERQIESITEDVFKISQIGIRDAESGVASDGPGRFRDLLGQLRAATRGLPAESRDRVLKLVDAIAIELSR